MTTILFQTIAGVLLLILLLDYFNKFRMIKSLFNRLRKRADDAAESVRDPIADAHVALADIKKKKDEIVSLRKNLLFEVKKAQNKRDLATKETLKFESLAQLAGQANNVEDVRLALEKKAVAEKEKTQAELDVTRLSNQENALEDKIREFDNLISRAENDKTYLESSLKINKFNVEVNNVLKEGSGSAVSALDRLRVDVENSAIEAELSGESTSDTKDLENKYLSASTSVSQSEVDKYLKK